MHSLNLKSSTIIIASVLLVACSSSKTEEIIQTESVVKSPFKGIDVKQNFYTIDASKDEQILTQEGTTITIPANSLVDKKGKKIRGKVQLNYRSIDTPGEIIASGIPMTYDSLGVKYDFISAGMFEIGAKQNEEEVFIAKGKQINVDFASFKNGNDFSFYKLDTKTGDWSFKGITAPKINQKKIQKLQRFKDDNLIELDVDYSVNEEIKEFDKLKWVCVDEKDKNNPIKHKWILKENWYDISLKTIDASKGIYEMKLSNAKKSVAFKVSPYQLDDESIASMNTKVNTLNETVKAKKIEEARIQLEADINRNFAISSFGTYNWDKIDKLVSEGALAVTNAAFEIESKSLDKAISVFHFSGKDKLLSRITQKWEKLVYNPNETNKMLIVLPENYVAISRPEEFKRIANQKDFVFNLKKRGQKIKSIAELDQLLILN